MTSLATQPANDGYHPNTDTNKTVCHDTRPKKLVKPKNNRPGIRPSTGRKSGPDSRGTEMSTNDNNTANR